MSKIEICLLCFHSHSEKYYLLDTDEYRHKINSVMPEIDLEIVEEPVICTKCSDSLLSAYYFKANCLQTNEELQTFARDVRTPINLQDFLTQKHKDSSIIEQKEAVELKETLTQAKVERSSPKPYEKNSEQSSLNEPRSKRLLHACQICNKVFLRRYALEKHFFLHKDRNQTLDEEMTKSSGRKHRCTHCNLSFGHVRLLDNHIRAIHTKEKDENQTHQLECNNKKKTNNRERKYQCTYCGNSFGQLHILDNHIRSIHIKEKPYICEICGVAFPIKCALYSHKKRRHEPVVKNFACDICGKAFTINSILERHMLWHTGQKNYLCEVCSKGFVSKSCLTKHMRIHNGCKPFACPICHKTFTQNYNMKVHLDSCTTKHNQSISAE